MFHSHIYSLKLSELCPKKSLHRNTDTKSIKFIKLQEFAQYMIKRKDSNFLHSKHFDILWGKFLSKQTAPKCLRRIRHLEKFRILCYLNKKILSCCLICLDFHVFISISKVYSELRYIKINITLRLKMMFVTRIKETLHQIIFPFKIGAA